MFAQLFRARYKFPAFLQTTLFRPRYPPRLPAITTSQALSLPPTVKQNFSAQAEEADRDMDEDGVYEPPEENHFLSPEGGHGYHPSFAPGDLFGRRYEVVRKLGWANSSTVWLCLDKDAHEMTYVAVKILTAHATACIVGGLSPEFKVFKRIESADPSDPGFPFCLTFQYCFTTRSSVGGHIVFVTDVLGPNMKTLRFAQPNQIFTVDVAKRIIKQILLALDYLHRKCGYVHTDVKSDNVLAVLPQPITPHVEKHLRDNPWATYDPPPKSASSQPFITVKSQPLSDSELGASLCNLRVRLIDYGAATPIDKQLHGEHYQANVVRAPEVILGHPWSSSVDVWSVGCLLFELTTNFYLFGQPDGYSVDMHLQNMVEYLGPFPSRFLELCPNRTKYFNEDGTLLSVTDFTPSSLEEIFSGIGVLSPEEIPQIATFLRRCLALDPVSRPSVHALLDDAWLEGV